MIPSDPVETRAKMQRQKVCAVLPTYNNGSTLHNVVERVLNFCSDVIVVNDGCTDQTAEILASFGKRITVVDYGRNKSISASTAATARPSARRCTPSSATPSRPWTSAAAP